MPVVIVPIEARDDRVVTAVFTKVPVVGKVTFVAPVVVNVRLFAPDVARLPPSVIVLVPLLMPVPPYVGLTTVPFQVPEVIVPTVASDAADVSDANEVTAVFTSVPVVGKVTFVVPVVVNVRGNAPEVARLSPSVIVFEPLLIPVPP